MKFDPNQTLITGAEGMVGNYIDFGIKTNHRSLDVTDYNEVLAVFKKQKPTTIIHLAAETDVDRCERDPIHAHIVNAIGTFNVVLASKEIGAKLVYVSTVYVFDGSKSSPYIETDIPHPINFYGRSKLLGEQAALLAPDALILRAGWMFGGGPKKDSKFVSKIVAQLKNPDIKAVNDKKGSLTFGKDLIQKIKELLQNNVSGIVHVANGGYASRYDIAEAINSFFGFPSRIIPVSSAEFQLDAKRADSDCMNSEKDGIMRPWQEAIRDYLEEFRISDKVN